MAEKEQGEPTGIVPYALALVVCDAIWRDPSTGKRTILGCFSAITAVAFPAKHPLMCVFAAMTDGHGKVPIALRLTDVDEERLPIFELKGEAVFADPRAVVEIDFIAGNLVFPTPGEYRLQLRSGSNLIVERRILVLQREDKHDDTDTETGHH
jgi:hypothetical protein